jgi:hypothetical protein
MCTTNAFDPETGCESSLILEVAATEALRGPIHSFATGIRAEGAALR